MQVQNIVVSKKIIYSGNMRYLTLIWHKDVAESFDMPDLYNIVDICYMFIDFLTSGS